MSNDFSGAHCLEWHSIHLLAMNFSNQVSGRSVVLENNASWNNIDTGAKNVLRAGLVPTVDEAAEYHILRCRISCERVRPRGL